EIAPGYDVIMYWDIGVIPPRSFKLAYRALPEGGMLLVGGCFGDRAERSVNLLTRKLTMVYPDHETIREAVENVTAAGFSRVKRVWIKDTARVVMGHK
ncbi:MAG: hypothetical protein ABIJ00_12355, partial [Candidatus Eisenbacteria bacterium]